ncbi:glycosyltransferase [Rudanella lutea]|uniref:glycosyltransferase n=1 Tax=Rudanella lutea TaxID=451374 RepID=UPI000378A968|nr:cellulose synthase catalytic subunit [Rudanella lutea]
MKKWPRFNVTSPNDLYNFSTRSRDIRSVRFLIVIGLLFVGAFGYVYFQPANRGYSWLFVLLTVSVVFKLLRLLHEWYHYWKVVPPVKPPVTRTWTVDVLTTYCPGEPHEMVINTLQAIQGITYPHTTYLCDEADDPYLKQVCAEMGVRHVTRTDKTDAKAGNINNALREATGDICLVIDPDHVPVPDFLDQVLPYFEDPNIGFVQCTQAYYNRKESVVAFGATEQTYSFYGPMMTCMGQYGTAQAIGANCTFRRAALDSIGGHANGLSEDMHTAMRLHANGWQSVYVPLPLSYGLVPATLSAYYKQQLKWSRGTFELLVTTLPRVFGGLTGRQKIHYLTLPLYYLLGVVQLIDLLIPICSLVMMRLPIKLDLVLFAMVYTPLLLTGFLIRQFAQRWLIERHEAGFHLLGGILAGGTWWVYVLGFVYTLFRVRVPYIPTPKDDRPRNNRVLILPNLLMVLATLGAITYSIYHYGRFALNNTYSQLMIGFGLVNVLMLSTNVLIGQELFWARLGNRLQALSTGNMAVWRMRIAAWKVRYGLYYGLRLSAIPLAGVVLLLTLGMTMYSYRTEIIRPTIDIRYANTQPFYVGMNGITKRTSVQLADSGSLIIPQSVRWSLGPGGRIGQPDWPVLAGQIPFLSIEPEARTKPSEQQIAGFLNEIVTHRHDAELLEFLRVSRAYGRPVLVSFLPQFDNPHRPWGSRRDTTLILYRMAWQRIVQLARQQRVQNLAWVWCPVQPSSISAHYPGSDFVHWIGLSVINDPTRAPDGRSHSFAALYQPLHTTIRTHAAYSIRQKPILLTHLYSAEGGAAGGQWLTEAQNLLHERYPQIRGVIFE